jgi:hypothetical protein
MAWEIEREQPTRLGHRMNFVGRSVSINTIAWDYRLQSWFVERPEDGEPARRCSVKCGACPRTLVYKVHSVAATRRRRTRRWIATVVCLIAVVPLLFLAAIDPSSAVVLSIAIGASVLAFVMSWTLFLAAATEVGIAGHGSWWPGYQKHKVFPRAASGAGRPGESVVRAASPQS